MLDTFLTPPQQIAIRLKMLMYETTFFEANIEEQSFKVKGFLQQAAKCTDSENFRKSHKLEENLCKKLVQSPIIPQQGC